MLEYADPEYVQIVEKYLEAQRVIVNHENAMDCSLWRPPEVEDEDFALLGDGKIVFVGKYEKGKYQELEIDYEMSEDEILSAVETMVIPLADPNSYESFTIEALDLVSVEPGGGIVLTYIVLCPLDQEMHSYILVKAPDFQ